MGNNTLPSQTYRTEVRGPSLRVKRGDPAPKVRGHIYDRFTLRPVVFDPGTSEPAALLWRLIKLAKEQGHPAFTVSAHLEM